jgi:hypothetical protein
MRQEMKDKQKNKQGGSASSIKAEGVRVIFSKLNFCSP